MRTSPSLTVALVGFLACAGTHAHDLTAQSATPGRMLDLQRGREDLHCRHALHRKEIWRMAVPH